MGSRQVKRLVSRPSPIHRSSILLGPRHKHDQFNPLMACNLRRKLLHFRVRRRERMSSVLKKRRKKMRKHKYKKLRRRQKFERRKS
jgi:hypothetical protein